MFKKSSILLSLNLLACVVCLSGPVGAEPIDPQLNQVYQRFQLDLNGDKNPESIQLKAVHVDDNGYSGQLSVFHSAGQLLWRGPIFKSGSQSPFPLQSPVFGGWHFGISNIDLIKDIDGNGKIELLSPQPQSDVRATSWRVFQWNGKAFVYQKSASLVTSKPDSGQYQWVANGQSAHHWISQLSQSGADTIAELYVTASNGDMLVGKAKVQLLPQGAKILQWIQKPSKQW